MSEQRVEDKILLGTKVSYGLGALGKDFAYSITATFLMFYYTDVAGISAAFVGTLFLVARAIDAFTDPIMGMIVDNTRSKFGKFRPWILIGTIVNSFALLAVFYTHSFTGTTLYVYAALTYILWGVTYTIMDIPFWSMIPALSARRVEREKLVVWPRTFASIAGLIMGGTGLYLVAELGDGDQGKGFFLLSVLVVISCILSGLITFFKVKEKVVLGNQVQKFTLADVKNIIFSNDQLKALIGSILTFSMAAHLVGGFAIYYFTYAIGRGDLFPIFAAVSGAAEIAGVLIFPWLCRYLPRHLMWYVAAFFPALACLILFVTGIFSPESVWLAGLAGAALRFGTGIGNGLGTVMLADVVDYGHYRSGQRSESIIFSVQTMLVKFAGAFAGFFIGMGLTFIGYVPNVEQSEETIFGLRALMIGSPIIFIAISVWVYKAYYRLNGSLREEVEENISLMQMKGNASSETGLT
jgi:melibiose permease